MKIDFSQTLSTLDGEQFTDNVGGKDVPVNLGKICIGALDATYQDETNLTGSEKYARFELIAKLKSASEVDVSSEDVTKLKTLIGKRYGVTVVGAAYDALEGKSRKLAPVVQLAGSKDSAT